MSIQNFLDYTHRIQSLEKNSVQIQKEALLSVVLVFPNSYEVAMSNLGFQSLYRLFNSYPDVRCERAFYNRTFPDIARSLESAQRFSNFDVIAFSLSFELDYVNVANILRNAGLSLFATERHPRAPLIIAGGVSSFINPEPLAPLIDIFFLGEIEPSSELFVDHLHKMKQERLTRAEVMRQLSEIDGFYIPQFHDRDKKVLKVTANVKAFNPQYSAVITPQSHFANMFLIEVGRGCGRYCHFCAASHVYHPVRFFPPEVILSNIEANIHTTRKIGLVGAALCDYPHLLPLCKQLVANDYQLGLSSFRFEAITESFLEIIQQGGIRTITLAPEAGSERLRRVLNKPLSDEKIQSAICLIAASEIPNLKLYFMIGLPYERDEDITAIIDSVKQIHKIFIVGSKRKRELAVSINAFIPKPFTPFQWCAMEDEKRLKQKRRFIESELQRLPGVKLNRKNVSEEIVQAIYSNGDRHVADHLSEITLSKHPLKALSKSLSANIYQEKSFHDPLPWDFISHPISKEKLWHQWQRVREIALS